MTETTGTSETRRSVIDVLLVGNPNTGKTSVFNSLTGLRQKTGNYPGVTVEKKTGIVTEPDGSTLRLHDMPGMYSLTPKSLDDSIAREVLIGEAEEDLDIRLIVVVADASNLNRNLYLVTQLIDLGIPVAVAMNMMDNAVSSGVHIDLDALSEQLQVPIVPVVASRQQGIDELRRMMFDQIGPVDRDSRPAGEAETEPTGEAGEAGPGPTGEADSTGPTGPAPPSPRVSFAERFPRRRLLGGLLDEALAPAAAWFGEHTNLNKVAQTSEALRVTSSDQALQTWMEGRQDPSCKEDLKRIVEQTRGRLDELQVPWRMLETILRYDQIDDLYSRVVREDQDAQASLSVRLDRAFTHRIAGPVIVLAVFALVFQSIFSWAEAPMTLIEDGIAALGAFVYQFLPAGMLRDLLVDGVIAGVGAVLVFLPQILFLFFFLALLEDTGYMARVAFIMDRFMKSMGLSGHSVMPLLSSFACAIPGIMATRTIKNWKDRLITIMIAPLMSCSARLPVYILLIGAFFPSMTILGVFTLQGLMLFSMYIFGIVVAIGAALVFKRLFMKDAVPTSFVMELPPYRRPSLKWVLLQMYERAKVFVTEAGQIILAISVVLWFLASYPQPDDYDSMTSRSRIQQSYAGELGQLIEPAIEPLGFDWKVGIGLITSFVAREVLVSTMATIYNVEEADETSVDLRSSLRSEVDPETGDRVYTPLVAVSLMVFFALACQCMATVAIVKRETNGWKWPIVMVLYMTALAYVGSLVVYQGGLLLGYG
ncbi:MAG: ferrous iron transport protein B [Gemmatimonadetes bacterium]|nr:ferrous iron transport protein B [Gemmatimonadota bacterium]MYD26847.1 ferrous iron transport protein B [Gemmatimonadota bacterium]MYI98746.1 ferrous iron transport protein B [Gemmatimonadota bacterium]